mmetsp:Transcript_3540/g.6879  ORF Transcript_3540/g.6879 Transcript_3540/m.6879 type:complete len:240 (-) Transcript_3540:148-867(-)
MQRSSKRRPSPCSPPQLCTLQRVTSRCWTRSTTSRRQGGGCIASAGWSRLATTTRMMTRPTTAATMGSTSLEPRPASTASRRAAVTRRTRARCSESRGLRWSRVASSSSMPSSASPRAWSSACACDPSSSASLCSMCCSSFIARSTWTSCGRWTSSRRRCRQITRRSRSSQQKSRSGCPTSLPLSSSTACLRSGRATAQRLTRAPRQTWPTARPWRPPFSCCRRRCSFTTPRRSPSCYR